MVDLCEKPFFKTSFSRNYAYRVLHGRFPPFGFVLKPFWSIHMFLRELWQTSGRSPTSLKDVLFVPNENWTPEIKIITKVQFHIRFQSPILDKSRIYIYILAQCDGVQGQSLPAKGSRVIDENDVKSTVFTFLKWSKCKDTGQTVTPRGL